MLRQMAVSLGDFKPDEIYNLIENKDPLGLNIDIQGHMNTNNAISALYQDGIHSQDIKCKQQCQLKSRV